MVRLTRALAAASQHLGCAIPALWILRGRHMRGLYAVGRRAKSARGHSSLPGKWMTRHPNMFSVSLKTDGVPWVCGACFAAYKSQAGLGKTPEGWPVYSQSRTRTFFPF